MNNNVIKDEIENVNDFKIKLSSIALSDPEAFKFFSARLEQVEKQYSDLDDNSGLDKKVANALEAFVSLEYDFDLYLSTGKYGTEENYKSDNQSGVEKYKAYRLKVFKKKLEDLLKADDLNISVINAVIEKWQEEQKRGSSEDPKELGKFKKQNIIFKYSSAETNIVDYLIAKMFLKYQLDYAKKEGVLPQEKWEEYTNKTNYGIALKEALVERIKSLPEKSDDRISAEELFLNWDADQVIGNEVYWKLMVGKPLSLGYHSNDGKENQEIPTQTSTGLMVVPQVEQKPFRVILTYEDKQKALKTKTKITDKNGRIIFAGPFTMSKKVTSIQFTEGMEELRWTQDGDSRTSDFNYRDFKDVTTITLPASLKRIEQGFFMGFKNLKTIRLAPGCTESLSREFIPKGVTIETIPPEEGERPAGHIEDLKEKAVVIELHGITERSHPLVGVIKRNLTESSGIPKSLLLTKAMYQMTTFRFTEGVEEIYAPNAVDQTDSVNAAFKDFIHFDNVSLPQTLKNLSPYTFEDCAFLEELKLPSQIKSIPKGCFKGCKELTSINLDNISEEIGESAFENCSSLFYGVPVVTFSDKLSKIGSQAFKSCYCIESIEMPPHLVYIGGSVFEHCRFQELSITGSNITKIYKNEYPFENNELRKVIFANEEAFRTNRDLFLPVRRLLLAVKDKSGKQIPVPYEERDEYLRIPKREPFKEKPYKNQYRYEEI